MEYFFCYLDYFKNTHGLLIAASVLTFIIGFCGGLFVLARKTMELKNFLSTPVNTESKDQNSLGTIK
jgi:F0F1-type ATP synthase assembly protein I